MLYDDYATYMIRVYVKVCSMREKERIYERMNVCRCSGMSFPGRPLPKPVERVERPHCVRCSSRAPRKKTNIMHGKHNI